MAKEKLTEQDLTAKIKEAENKTNAEILCLYKPASNDYLLYPAIFSDLLSIISAYLLLPLITKYFAPTSIDHLILSYIGLAFIFFPLYFWIFNIPRIKRLIIPKKILKQEAEETAHAEFFKQGLYKTKNANGILVFVSQLEHYAIILADEGINKNDMQETWDNAVKTLTTNLKKSKSIKGYISAIDEISKGLSKHHPKTKDDEDEIKNTYIS
jgi:putative membrane protein